jgi:septum formation protein
MALILASTSPYRRQLLARLGLPFDQMAPMCDEQALKDPGLDPEALAVHLAAAKARSIASAHPDDTVIGSDQLAAVDDTILGKPGTPERALEQLQLLSGRSHRLITAVHVVHRGQDHAFTDTTTLTMPAHERAALQRYVAADEPLDCAGAYKIEERGIGLFSRIESDDHTAITGLPLLRLANLLRELGYRVP